MNVGVDLARRGIGDAGDELNEVFLDRGGRRAEGVVAVGRRAIPGKLGVVQEEVGHRHHGLEAERLGIIQVVDVIEPLVARGRGAAGHAPVVEPHQVEAVAGDGAEVIAVVGAVVGRLAETAGRRLVLVGPQRSEGVVVEIGIGQLVGFVRWWLGPARPGRLVVDAAIGLTSVRHPCLLAVSTRRLQAPSDHRVARTWIAAIRPRSALFFF